MTVHSSFKRNQKIILMFKSKEKLITRYKEKKSGKIITSDGEFYNSDLRSANVYSPPAKPVP